MDRKRLNGSTIQIVTRWHSIYDYDIQLIQYNSTRFQFVGGYGAHLFLELSHMLNFSYVFRPDVDTYDFEEANRKNIDLYVGSFSVYDSRAEVVDPSFLTGASKILALMNHDYEKNSFNFLAPFDANLWLVILLFLLIILAAFALLGTNESYSLGDRIFHGLSMAMLKSVDAKFKSIQALIVAWTTMVTFYILYTSYAGSMVSILAVTKFRIQSINQLLLSDYVIMLERGADTGSVIQAVAERLTNMKIIQHLLRKARSSNFVYESFEKSLMLVANSVSAYIIDEETAAFTLQNSPIREIPCSWGMLPIKQLNYPWAMMMRKHWIFKHDFNSGLLRLRQSGIMIRASRAWLPNFSKYSSRCIENNVPVVEGVTIEGSFWGFVAYGLAMLFSVSWMMLIEMELLRSYFSRTCKNVCLLLGLNKVV